MKSDTVKARVRHELIEYGLNVVYLSLVFAAFTVYRRLALASFDIVYTNYWMPVVEALILGKVIMIGSLFRLGRGLETRPLIYSTLYKTVVFVLLVAGFKLIEHGVRGVWRGVGFWEGIVEASEKGVHEILANSLVIFVSLAPFFAVRELGRVLGREQLAVLFFRKGIQP